MKLTEMHVWFRQYAQQMGMQNVRAILPEQIDLLINTSISDTTNEIIKAHIAATNDRVVTDNSKLDQINTLRTLHDVAELKFRVNSTIADLSGEATSAGSNVGAVTDFDTEPGSIENNTELPAPIIEDTASMTGKWVMDNLTKERDDDTENYSIKALYIIDLSINYKVGNKISAFYPVRLIDDSYLADVMQDYALSPRVRTPAAVIYNNKLELYLGEDYKKGNGLLKTNTIIPNVLRVSYLKYPNKVKYVSDLGTYNEECDLPENMHIDILKHAVDLYNVSIQGSLYAAQQQQQRQNREMARNTARPDNEGYQQQ